MNRMKTAALTATVALGVLAGVAGQASAQGVTAYEGARVIVGDGRVLDNATIVVNGTKITQVGGTVPAGATRVNLAGKTVMPMFIDTHMHASTTRDGVVRDLKQRAYFGVSAVMSMGTDSYDAARPAQQGHARHGALLQRRQRHQPERGTTSDPADQQRRGSAQGGAGQRGAQGRHHQGLGRRPRRQGRQSASGSNMRPSSTRLTRTAFA